MVDFCNFIIVLPVLVPTLQLSCCSVCRSMCVLIQEMHIQQY